MTGVRAFLVHLPGARYQRVATYSVRVDPADVVSGGRTLANPKSHNFASRFGLVINMFSGLTSRNTTSYARFENLIAACRPITMHKISKIKHTLGAHLGM